eukprot:Tamp_15244.p1 GENE.Tamp_15244~~Tamp_15244.p1  ORF type:complete len:495 (+),score=86.36 Tamp_15244:22-1485(+)
MAGHAAARPAALVTAVAALTLVAALAVLAVVFPYSPQAAGRGDRTVLLQRRARQDVVRVCPECATSAAADAVSLSSILGGAGNAVRAPASMSAQVPQAYAAPAREQQFNPVPQRMEQAQAQAHWAQEQQMAQMDAAYTPRAGAQGAGGQPQAASARTQQLPYRVSGSLELPEPAYGSVTTTSNPDLAIRFTQSHLEPPEGMNAPVVPKPIWDDAQATKRMAAHLKRVLRKQKGVANDMQARVDRLRAFIVDNAADVVKETDDLDAELTTLILKRKTRGVTGKQGAPGTPGLPGPAGAQGTNGSPGATGARGHRGVPGPRGETGTAGHAGSAGATGHRGIVGPRGPKGKQGELGPQGHEPGVYMATLKRPSLSSFNPSLCPDGDNGVVRLAACTSKACRLEVLHQDHWGSVCDDKFTHVNARVVCASLGYPAHRAEALHELGGGTGRVWLDDVECGGDEEQLTMCKHAGWGLSDCKHDEDVGVCCRRF